jgi:L-threonylcarbamoyladenylate synthase
MMVEEINKCIEVLNSGGIILYPTDTVWGLGCDATNEVAVEKIFKLKQRAEAKSLIVLVCNDAMLNKHVKEVPELAWDIIDLAQKPTTLIYPLAKGIADNAIAEDNSIAIRMIKNDFCNKLIYKFRKPIVSTSANISNTITPITFNEISDEIINGVDYVVNSQFDSGNGTPSSLLKLGISGEIKVLRK